MDNHKYQNLFKLIGLFKDRPHHLSQFLIENKALTDEFLEKVKNSRFSSNYLESKQFNTIEEMRNHFNILIDDLDNLKSQSTKEELINELNKKLCEAILSENYEEAARIRDYIKINNIKKDINL